MLEKYIASLLVPYLSRYVENIDERQLSVDIWNGKATLTDLELKRDVLNTLLGAAGGGADAPSSSAAASPPSPSSPSSGTAALPPLRVHRGLCKSVTLDIPIRNLRSRPVVLNIGELLITLVAPNAAAEGAEGAEGGDGSKSHRWDRIAAAKARQLDAFEEERRKEREAAAAAAAAAAEAGSSAGGKASEDPNSGGFFSKLTELVVNNIIVKVNTVHIRYEDVARRVVLGAVLGGVQLLTIDDRTGEATFVDPSGLQRMGKRLDLEGLQVYCDDPRHMVANEAIGRCWTSRIPERQGWYHAMRQRSRDGSVALSTVFGPVTCSVDARVVFKHFVRQLTDTPYMTVTARMQHIVAHLTRPQYTTLVKSISHFTNWREEVEVAARRPRVPVKGHARQWWRFAIGTVMDVQAEPRRARLLARISEVCRLDYHVLYRDVVRRTDMSPEKRRSYRFVTRFMTVEDMIAGRKHVYAQLANEIQLRRKDKETKRAEAEAEQQQSPVTTTAAAPKKGWWQWLRGSSAEGGGDASAAGGRALSAEEAEEEAFFRDLQRDYGISADDDGSSASSPVTTSADLPPAYTWLALTASLPCMSFQIDMEDGESACLSFFQIHAQACRLNKANSTQFHFSVQNMTLSNPAAEFEGGSLLTNLIEGVSITKSTSASTGSTTATSSARSVHVRTVTEEDNGKARPDRPPTLREILGLAPDTAAAEQQQQQQQHVGRGASPGGGGSSLGSSLSSVYATPVLHVSGALHPVEQPLDDTNLDVAVRVRLLPLRVVADPGTIRRIVHFFRVPRGVDLSYIADSTRSAASAVGTAASQELRTAMASARGVFIAVDAAAPIILVPKTLRATRREATLAISLGRVRFHAQPLKESEKARRLRSAEETEEMLYYRNNATFSKFFVELTTLEDALLRPETGTMLVPNLAIAACVLQRIDDRNDTREQLIVRLKVPTLQVALSVHQVFLLTSMIDAWLQNWSTGAASAAVLQDTADQHGCEDPGYHRSSSAGGEGGGEDAWSGGRSSGHVHEAGISGFVASFSESLALSQQQQRGEHNRSPPPPPVSAYAGRAGRRSGTGGPGYGGGGGEGRLSAGGSVTSSPSSTASPLMNRCEDLPIFRLELLVEHLSLNVHEDDAEALTPITPARFSLSFTNAELILAARTMQQKVLLYLAQPRVADLKDPAHPILCGTTAVRVDVGLSPDAPTALGVIVEPSLQIRVGTPLMELLETTMDIVNLILSCLDGGPDDGSPLAQPGAVQSLGSFDGLPSATDDDADVLEAMSRIGGDGGVMLSAEAAARQMKLLQARKHTLSDLAYQLGLVRLQNAMPDTRVVNMSIHVDGTATVELLNRGAGDTVDECFVSASATDLSLFIKKNKVTMEVTGKVGEVAARLADSHGLLPQNSYILRRTAALTTTTAAATPAGSRAATESATSSATTTPTRSDTRQPSPAIASAPKKTTDGGPLSDDTAAAGGGGGSSSRKSGKSAGAAAAAAAPHIAFSYSTNRPVMPLFVTQADGKRVLTNASELRFSNSVELELCGSTVSLDVASVMLLKHYFTGGFFSRLPLVADRPLYNGRTLPPARQGPRLLMSVRVVARDIAVALPLDARRTTECFRSTVGSLVVQSSLHAAEAQQTMSISLRDVSLWRDAGGEGAAGAARDLLPSHVYIDMALRSPIDAESDHDARLDVKSEDMTAEITSAELLDLCQLLRQNLSRSAVCPAASVAVDPVTRVYVASRAAGGRGGGAALTSATLSHARGHGDGGSVHGGGTSGTAAPSHAHGGGGILIGLRFAHTALRFSDKGGAAADAGARFELSAAGVGLYMHHPSLATSVSWRSLELLDTRGGTASALVRCDEGEAHVADSLTTRAIVMADFGVRPAASQKAGEGGGGGGSSAAVGDDDDEDMRSRPGRRGGCFGSVSGSDATASPSQRHSVSCTPAARAPATELLSMRVLSVAFTLRHFAVSDQWLSIYDCFCNEAVVAAASAPQVPTPWAALEGPLGEQSDAAADADSDALLRSGGGGFRCVLTTPSVVVPFLTAERATIMEASITSLLFDTVTFPGSGAQVAVKVGELEVTDSRSGERIISRRRRQQHSTASGGGGAFNDDSYSAADDRGDGSDHRDDDGALTAGYGASPSPRLGSASGEEGGFSSPPAKGAGMTATSVKNNTTAAIHTGQASAPAGAPPTSSAPGSDASEPEALNVLFKSDPKARKNRLMLSMGPLDAVCSMPLLYGLIDYAISPTQPIARISSLGVMQEQRRRVAKAAKDMADSNAMSVHVLWHQPRVVLVGDGLDLTNRARRLEARLGTMRASVALDNPNKSLTAEVKLSDFSVPDVLEKSALQLKYTAKDGKEDVHVALERVVGLFYPTDVDRMVYVLQGNLTLPHETYYYGKFDPPSSAAHDGNDDDDDHDNNNDDAKSSSSKGGVDSAAGQQLQKPTTARPSSPPAPVRTITLVVSGVVLQVFDFVGINTHTASLSSLSFAVASSGDYNLVIPTVCVTENFTNCAILASGSTDSSGSPVPEAATTAAAAGGSNHNSSSSAGAAKPSRPKPAVAMAYTKATNVTAVAVSDVVLSMVPRGTGTLANTLLSIHVPKVNIGVEARAAAAAAAAAAEERLLMSRRNSSVCSNESITLGSGGSRRAIEAPLPVSKIHPAGGAAKASERAERAVVVPVQSFRATLDGCGLRFIHGEATFAFAKFAHIGVAAESYRDGSSLLNATVEDFTMEDCYSANLRDRRIISRYVDDDADLNATSRREDALRRKVLDVTVWTAPPHDQLARSMSISRLDRSENLYAKRIYCEVGNLSFTVVPDLARSMAGVITEVLQHVSNANRGKAYDYVSDTAAAAAQAVVSNTALELTELEVVVHRPRFVILQAADADRGIELFPGRLVVRSELGMPEDPPHDGAAATAAGPRSPMDDLLREMFRVRVERMGVRLLGFDAFKEDCHIDVTYQSALRPPQSMRDVMAEAQAELARDGVVLPDVEDGAAAAAAADTASVGSAGAREGGSTAAVPYRDEAELRVHIPRMTMNLSDDQTEFSIDILGAFLNSEGVKKGRRTSVGPVSSVASVGSGAVDVPGPGGKRRAAGGMSPLSPTGSGSPRWQPYRAASAAVAGAGHSTTSSPLTAGRGGGRRVRSSTPSTSKFRTDFFIGHLEADLAELFRLSVEKLHMRAESSEASGTRGLLKVDALRVQHVGAQVEVTDARSGARRSERVDDIADLLNVTGVLVESIAPPVVFDDENWSSQEERTIDVSLDSVSVAVSPTILFDTRELLYLPFCAKVLRRPIEPIPVLMLETETTVMAADTTLDSMHVLLTGNRKRCCYHLDLGQHTLYLTGQPSAQIVLSEGCEVTISNGTIVIPGLYSLGSYVSFAATSALFTTDTCTVEKHYQNIANTNFALRNDSLKATAAAAAAAAAGRDSRRVPSPSSRHSPLTVAVPPPGHGLEYGGGGGAPLQRNARMVCNFACPQITLQVLSEETPDLSSSLCMEAIATLAQDTENGEATQRSVSVQLFQVQSGKNEQYMLLPTTVNGNFSGVENVSVSLVFGPLEFCSRAVLLRSFVEIAKDFGAAFIEDTTVKRVRPTVQLETTEFVTLIPVVAAGDCTHCGQQGVAYLSEHANTPGTLCYKCCTGHDSMPATDFRVEIPLVDGILLASSGDLAHAHVRNILLSVDPNMDVQLSLRGSLHNFSNAAAVWEPFVEQFVCGVSGSVNTHDYRVHVDRLDYVVSPLNLRVLRTFMADYASSTTLQKRMRKKFRRQTQLRAAANVVVGNNTGPMYVDDVAVDEDDRVAAPEKEELVEDEIVFGSTLRGTGSAGRGALSNTSIFDRLSAGGKAAKRGTHPSATTSGAASSPPPPPKPYAHVEFENWCNTTLLVNKKPVSPRGGKLAIYVVEREVIVEREQPSSPSDTGYVLSLTTPPLYAQATDFFMETHVDITREEATRSLRRVVRVLVLPLHGSKTLICMENRMSCWLCPGGNLSDLAPGERLYFRTQTDLTTPLMVRPTKMRNGLAYKPAVTAEGRPVSVQDILLGVPVSLVCAPAAAGTAASPTRTAAGATTAAGAVVPPLASEEVGGAAMFMSVVARQDAMRGGVPTFVISIEPRCRICSKLPFPIRVSVALDKNGDVARGRAQPRKVQTLTVAAMEKVEIGSGVHDISEVAIIIQATQPSGGGSNSNSNSSSSAAETFTSPPIAVKTGVVRLTSGRREMVVKLLVTNGNVLVTTPFTLLNHTDYPLTLRECSVKGEVRGVSMERNYSTLPAKMHSGIAACPIDADKEDFLVNLYWDCYVAKVVPLHVQQRGVILMEESNPQSPTKSKSSSSSKSKKGAAVEQPQRSVIHLAYLAKMDASGSVLVTITPRWVVVNRSPRMPLYVAPTAELRVSAREANAAAVAQVAAQHEGKGSPAATPTSRQTEVDAFRNALINLSTPEHMRLTDTTYVVAIGPGTARPLYITPYCAPEIGYRAYVLQAPDAPLFGSPIQLETIHNEMIVTYRSDSATAAAGGGGGGGSSVPAARPQRGAKLATQGIDRDHFIDVSLMAQDSYTYVTLEEPTSAPYVFLNRSRYCLELVETAPKSAGRLMARAPSGCGTGLILDPTISTTMQVILSRGDDADAGGSRTAVARFDVSRPMTAAEKAAVAADGFVYKVSYGELGQLVVEVLDAVPFIPRARTVRACPPVPINVLLNMALLTVSVVIPNRDVLFAAITDTRIAWDRGQFKEELHFSIRNFQVDNQTEVSPRYDACVLALRKTSEATAISGYGKRTLTATKALLWLDEVRLDVTPIALRVSDTLLVSLARFGQMASSDGDDGIGSGGGGGGQGVAAAGTSAPTAAEAAGGPVMKNGTMVRRCPTAQALFDGAPQQMDMMATRVLLDRLIVNPLLIRLWLTREVDESDFFRDNLHTKEASLLSMMVASCEDVNVSAPGLVAVKRTSRLGVLLQWILKSYMDGLFAQIQGVALQYAASLPLIGAPVKLFSGIGSGAVRMFREPVDGLSTSPKAFAQGLARGSGGLAAGVAGGGLGAFSNLANAGSRLLSAGGGVSEKDRRRQNTWTGFTSGIAGIVQRPMEGAAESGASGFMLGTAQGLVGVLANPLSGFLSDVSWVSGTAAKFVTDTYIPQTQRLRPLRDFHANGGVAPWRSVITVFQYERITRGSGQWGSAALLSGVDGPAWYPCRREAATFGRDSQPVPGDRWLLDRHSTSFDGWTFSSKYYGYYSGAFSDAVRVRRKRWTALVRPLPYSPMAFFLGIAPGMARAPRTQQQQQQQQADGAVADVSRQTTVINLDYETPGVLAAATARPVLEARETGRGRRGRGSSGGVLKKMWRGSHQRSQSSDFFNDDDETLATRRRSVHQRLRDLTGAGRNVGVRVGHLRSHSGVLDDDDDDGARESVAYSRASSSDGESVGASGSMMRPSAPRSGRFRRDRSSSASGRSRGKDEPQGYSGEAGGAVPLAPPPSSGVRAAPRLAGEEQRPPARTATVELFEYEKRATLWGWGKNSLPSQCPPWQDAQGRAVPSRQDMAPPQGWRWTGPWQVVGGDEEGWAVVRDSRGSSSGKDNLRRRLWRRTMTEQQ